MNLPCYNSLTFHLFNKGRKREYILEIYNKLPVEMGTRMYTSNNSSRQNNKLRTLNPSFLNKTGKKNIENTVFLSMILRKQHLVSLCLSDSRLAQML